MREIPGFEYASAAVQGLDGAAVILRGNVLVVWWPATHQVTELPPERWGADRLDGALVLATPRMLVAIGEPDLFGLPWEVVASLPRKQLG